MDAKTAAEKAKLFNLTDKKVDESARDVMRVMEAIDLAASKGKCHVKIDIMFASTVKTLHALKYKVDEDPIGNSCVILW
jgi:hypothetical protein